MCEKHQSHFSEKYVRISRSTIWTKRRSKFIQPFVRKTIFGINSFRYEGNKIWNNLPEQIKNANDVKKFKQLIHQWSGPKCHCGNYILCNANNVSNMLVLFKITTVHMWEMTGILLCFIYMFYAKGNARGSWIIVIMNSSSYSYYIYSLLHLYILLCLIYVAYNSLLG